MEGASMSQWPNFFVAGAPRCGTSTLHACLSTMPGVFMARIKEPNFFSSSVIGETHPMVKPIRSVCEYLKLFAAAGDAKAVGEATPFYLNDPDAPSRIRGKSPNAKVLASLRDPVERLYSHYLMMRNNVSDLGSFLEEFERGLTLRGNREAAILDPSVGLYSRQLERFQGEFGYRGFKVIILEQWAQDLPRTLIDISRFLGLGPPSTGAQVSVQRRYSEVRSPVVRFLFGNRRVSRASEALVPYWLRKSVRNAVLVKEAPKPAMDPRARKVLREYYLEDVRRTELILGRAMPWPNFQAKQPSLLAG
jgi:hypothetical protein